jgi:ATP-dependent Clp protease protease subunit
MEAIISRAAALMRCPVSEEVRKSMAARNEDNQSPEKTTEYTQIDIRCEDEEKPEKTESLAEKLLDTRQLFLTGGIDETVTRKVIASLLMLEANDPKKPITLFVNSPGGSVNDGFAIYDTIRFIRPDVHIVCSGLCASIATVILVATEKAFRTTLPNTRFLIHQPLIYGQVQGQASDLEITAMEILKTRGKINDLLAEECDQPLEKVQKDTQRDYWMNAEEALKYGLISKVINSRKELDALS